MVKGKDQILAPDQGDLVWIHFDPQAGHEQSGRRPALVLSKRIYNEKVGLMVCCPVTNQIKGYPFEVTLPIDSPITGVVLADQVKSLDWKARRADVVARVPNALIQEVIQKIMLLF